MSLRPIGTVFSVVSPAAYNSTNPHPTRITYRVTAHSRAISPDGGETTTETLEPIGYEELPAPTLIPFEAFKSYHHYRAWQIDHAEKVAAETPVKVSRRRKRR